MRHSSHVTREHKTSCAVDISIEYMINLRGYLVVGSPSAKLDVTTLPQAKGCRTPRAYYGSVTPGACDTFHIMHGHGS